MPPKDLEKYCTAVYRINNLKSYLYPLKKKRCPYRTLFIIYIVMVLSPIHSLLWRQYCIWLYCKRYWRRIWMWMRVGWTYYITLLLQSTGKSSLIKRLMTISHLNRVFCQDKYIRPGMDSNLRPHDQIVCTIPLCQPNKLLTVDKLCTKQRVSTRVSRFLPFTTILNHFSTDQIDR